MVLQTTPLGLSGTCAYVGGEYWIRTNEPFLLVDGLANRCLKPNSANSPYKNILPVLESVVTPLFLGSLALVDFCKFLFTQV
jgi:hypothetical protein